MSQILLLLKLLQKNSTHFKTGQKRLENNYLDSLVSKSVTWRVFRISVCFSLLEWPKRWQLPKRKKCNFLLHHHHAVMVTLLKNDFCANMRKKWKNRWRTCLKDLLVQWKPHKVIALGQPKSDKIDQMIITDDFYLIIYSQLIGRLKWDYI